MRRGGNFVAQWRECLSLQSALIALLCVQSLLPFLELHRGIPPTDDELISLTYVKNLIAGNGFVFNHPPATLGTTSPMWVLFLAVIGFVVRMELHSLAQFMSALCLVLNAWSFMAFRRLFRLSAGEAAILGAATLTCTRYYVFGTEIPLFQLTLVTAAAVLLSRRFFWAGVAVGVLALVRGEGVLFGPVAYIAVLFLTKPSGIRDWRRWLIPGLVLIGGYAAVWAPWSLYAMHTFGLILPNTLEAKIMQGQSLPANQRFFAGLLQTLLTWGPHHHAVPPRLFSILQWELALLGLWHVLWNRPRFMLFGAWAAAYLVAHSILGMPKVYVWYQIPILLTGGWFLAMGFSWLIFQLPTAGTIESREWLRQGALVAALVLCVFVFGNRWYGIFNLWKDTRWVHYTQATTWIREHVVGQETVACPEVGFIGYHTNAKVLDLAGLVSPEMNDTPGNDIQKLAQYLPEYYLTYIGKARFSYRHPIIAGSVTYKPVAHFQTIEKNKYICMYKRQ